jgi:ATP-dependent DNA ligase
LLRGVKTSRIQYVDYFEGDGQAFFDAVCSRVLEGIVSKRLDSRY